MIDGPLSNFLDDVRNSGRQISMGKTPEKVRGLGMYFCSPKSSYHPWKSLQH